MAFPHAVDIQPHIALCWIKAVQEIQMLLSDIEVAALMSVSRNTIWRWVRNLEGFPQPVKIGGVTRWRKADLDKYITDLEAEGSQVELEEYIQKVAK